MAQPASLCGLPGAGGGRAAPWCGLEFSTGSSVPKTRFKASDIRLVVSWIIVSWWELVDTCLREGGMLESPGSPRGGTEHGADGATSLSFVGVQVRRAPAWLPCRSSTNPLALPLNLSVPKSLCPWRPIVFAGLFLSRAGSSLAVPWPVCGDVLWLPTTGEAVLKGHTSLVTVGMTLSSLRGNSGSWQGSPYSWAPRAPWDADVKGSYLAATTIVF